MPPEAIASAAAFLAAYVSGATPFGYVAGRVRGIDIRQHGSGNIGATNVIRVMGKAVGLPVFLLDILKGFGPVWITQQVCAARGIPAEWPAVAAALGAVLGHNFTFWLGFRGGKGIATSAGILLALLQWPLVTAAALWLVLFFATRYVAVASIGAALTITIMPAVLWTLHGDPGLPRVGLAAALGLLAVWRHRANIKRLLHGTENRFVRKPKPSPPAA